MKSFGLWYISNQEEKPLLDPAPEPVPSDSAPAALPGSKSNPDPVFSLHINFWDLEEVSKKHESKPFLDVGIKITHFKSIKKIIFYCPFIVNSSEFEDLSDSLKEANTAKLIFNEKCVVEDDGDYSVVKIMREEKAELLLLFSQKHPSRDVINIKPVHNPEDNEVYTDIEFDFEKYDFKQFSESVEAIYIRFRIKSLFSTSFYFDTEPLNKSFESAFSGTRIIDFKINESRNIETRRLFAMGRQNENYAEFEKIHLLIMEPSSYQIQAIPDYEMKCREVEEGMWKTYLGSESNVNDKHVLAYHWTRKAKEGEKIQTFTQLVRVNYSKARLRTILIYALSVIALGLISSLIVSSIFSMLPNNVGRAVIYNIAIIVILLFIVVKCSRKR